MGNDKNRNRANPIQVQKYLSGMHYPASKEQLVKHAQDRGADDQIVHTLERLPDGNYDAPTEVTKAIGRL